MTQYLLSVYQPDGAPPSPQVLGPIMQKVHAWNNELKAAGAWVFTGGLHPASTATVLRVTDGDVVMTDGPFTARLPAPPPRGAQPVVMVSLAGPGSGSQTRPMASTMAGRLRARYQK